MKKNLFIGLFIAISAALISWGGVGHKTIGTIAENHLTPAAKAGIRNLIGDTAIADIASWADQARSTPAYKYTGPWHYLEFTLGMNYQDFKAHVNTLDSNNVYGAILKCERDIKSPMTTTAQKAIALKFLVHFIGDCHQPMHLSKASDRGGNDLQIQFNGKGSNLHSLWDSGLINKEGKTFDQMAKDYDIATPSQIKQWQSDSPMKWVFESYQIASKIYDDMDRNGRKPDDVYYQANITVVQQRIEMAGIRLAGTLNELFK
jgi:hypothetical protein